MSKNIVYSFVLVFILFGVLGVVIRVPKVEATICINADGSINPPTANITTADNVTYVFTGDVNETIWVQRDNIVIDGANYILYGAGSGTGIYLDGRCNVTIKNVYIENFNYGIYIYESSNSTVLICNITANNDHGIYVRSSAYNNITGNHIRNNGEDGIFLWDSSNYNILCENTITEGGTGITVGDDSYNNSVYGNNLTNNYSGIAIKYCSNNTLRNNTIISTYGHDFGISATNLQEFINDVGDSNTVQGKPIYYWVNIHNSTVPSDAGCVILANCTNINIQNVNISRNSQGVIFAHTTNATVANSNITDTQYCIWLWNSSDCHVNENYVSLFIGIQLDYSSNNTIYGNVITGCGNWGGIGIYMSSNNTFYHNNFTDNYRHVLADAESLNNWDNGYPDGGNYWDDFKDRYPHVNDVYGGPYQNETGSDGFWDGPYTVYTDNIDHYPIVPEFSSATVLSLFMILSIVAVIFASKRNLEPKT